MSPEKSQHMYSTNAAVHNPTLLTLYLIVRISGLHLGPRQLVVRLLSVNLDAELISSDIRQSLKINVHS